MADELDRYVSQRIPARTVARAVTAGVPVHVHGVYPTHLPAADLGYRSITALPGRTRETAVNFIRPVVFSARERRSDRQCMLIAVPPGRDYLRHYASLVRYTIRRAGADEATMLAAWRYPDAETGLATWTGLDSDLLVTPATVVFGKIDLLEPELRRHGWQPIRKNVTQYYRLLEYSLPGRGSVALLGVNFSYWGSAAASLVVRCCELGAQDVLYVGKLGTLTSPADLYARLFVPSAYARLDHCNLDEISSGPPNGVLGRFPSLATGLHVSVPTVLEEDYAQRALAASLGAQTIDNELGQMALAVAAFNHRDQKRVSFSAIHYATDYLPPQPEVRPAARLSLANGRSPDAIRRRREVMRLVTDCLIEYLKTAIA
jgi:hypothetical protein